ncbi:DNAase [Pseudoxanthomonas broegbernensis]|uniref:DNAase n=1 Tax=Pseudoxanthomonas broegbernensis TaxID=83619 RepID=A0A7V8GPU4_9GAMM|nr:TatD family hydrolase [Pseudoxanthomonas broegbernensis]KAF1687879.1 DNAase [Pseudoxanthomonas broegbernensis]MBB6064868.1 TatD DNase family protein [Pseudoxanthomonas broegbernensis]
MDLVDSHCHLDAEEFDPDRAQVVQRARAAGVLRQVVPAVDAAGWPKLREVCAAAPGLYPAYGLHPVFLARHRPSHLRELHAWVERERPLAIGECGLDFFAQDLDRDAQTGYFEGQLRLALDTGLPLIVHARRAVDAVIASIRRIGGDGHGGARLRGVVHSFSGSEEQARQLWKLGFLIGLGGPLTYARAQRLHRLVAGMPLDCLLLETDAPDQPDAGIRGQRNEPARLRAVLDAVAALRGQAADEIAAATGANAERLFALPPP